MPHGTAGAAAAGPPPAGRRRCCCRPLGHTLVTRCECLAGAMAVQRISSLLDQLTPRFQRLDGTHAAQRTFGLAEQLVEAVSGAEQEGCNADGSLEG